MSATPSKAVATLSCVTGEALTLSLLKKSPFDLSGCSGILQSVRTAAGKFKQRDYTPCTQPL
jgi:hypothetical protein